LQYYYTGSFFLEIIKIKFKLREIYAIIPILTLFILHIFSKNEYLSIFVKKRKLKSKKREKESFHLFPLPSISA